MKNAVLDAIRSLPMRERAAMLALAKNGSPLKEDMIDSILLLIDERVKSEDLKDELLLLITMSASESSVGELNEAEYLAKDIEQRKPQTAELKKPTAIKPSNDIIVFRKTQREPVKLFRKKDGAKPVDHSKIDKEKSKEKVKVDILTSYASQYKVGDRSGEILKLYEELASGRSEGLPHPFVDSAHLYAFHSQGGGTRPQSYRNNSLYYKDIVLPQISSGAALVIKRKGEIHKAKSEFFKEALPLFQSFLIAFEKKKLKNVTLEMKSLIEHVFPDGISKALQAFSVKTSSTFDVDTSYEAFKKTILSESGGAVISHVSGSGRIKMAWYTDKKLMAFIDAHNRKIETWEKTEKLLLFGDKILEAENYSAKDELKASYIDLNTASIDDKILRKSCVIYIDKSRFRSLRLEKDEERIRWQENKLTPSAPEKREGKGKSDIEALNRVYSGTTNFLCGVPTVSAKLARFILSENPLFKAASSELSSSANISAIEKDLKTITKSAISLAGSGDYSELTDELRHCKFFSPSHLDEAFIERLSMYAAANASAKKRLIKEFMIEEGHRFVTKAPFSWIIEHRTKGVAKRSWHPKLVELLQAHIGSKDLDRRTRYAVARLLYCQLSQIEHKLADIAGVSEKAIPPKGAKDSTPAGLREYSNLLKSLYQSQVLSNTKGD